MTHQHKLDHELSPGGTCRTGTALSPWQGGSALMARSQQQLCSAPVLTYVREHADAALHRGLLAGQQPGAVVHPEHPLQQLHEHGLPGLQSKHSSVTALTRSSPTHPSSAASLQSLLTALQICWATPRGTGYLPRDQQLDGKGGKQGWKGNMKQELLQQKALVIIEV